MSSLHVECLQNLDERSKAGTLFGIEFPRISHQTLKHGHSRTEPSPLLEWEVLTDQKTQPIHVASLAAGVGVQQELWREPWETMRLLELRVDDGA